jgi:hypothetical protein
MKKNILMAVLTLFGFSAFSQITINRSDFAVAGDWYLLADDTSLSVSASNALKVAGANKTWDLTGWADRNFTDTTFYANGLTYPAAPAGCNLVSFTRDPITKEEFPDFLIISNTALRSIFDGGQTTGPGAAIKVFSFPSTMGTKFKDSTESFMTSLASDFGINIPFVDSVKIIYKLRNTSEVDAWGKLKLDAGQFDVIRQVSTIDIVVSLKIRNTITRTYTDLPAGSGFDPFSESNKSYIWMGTNSGNPLLTASTDTLGNIVDMTFMLASSRGVASGLKDNKALAHASKVYPVPASDLITIETQASKNSSAYLSVYDILGNEVLPSKEVEVINGLNQLPVQINQLKPGVYFYTLTGNGINTSSRFVVK